MYTRLLYAAPAIVLAACSSSSTPAKSNPADGGSSDAGGAPLASMSIGAQGGTLSVTAAQDPTLAGTSIMVPAGVLAQNVTIAILASSSSVTASGEQAAGPVVDFEPSGTSFTAPVTITIPVSLPGGASASSLKIAAVEPNGMRQELAVQSMAGGLATFQASGFTGFGGVVTGSSGGCTSSADCAGGMVCASGVCQ